MVILITIAILWLGLGLTAYGLFKGTFINAVMMGQDPDLKWRLGEEHLSHLVVLMGAYGLWVVIKNIKKAKKMYPDMKMGFSFSIPREFQE
ncbi:MAG: hypothetical protein Q8O87_03000 [bacterium]|nr:hypothetical protein [bacterium]